MRAAVRRVRARVHDAQRVHAPLVLCRRRSRAGSSPKILTHCEAVEILRQAYMFLLGGCKIEKGPMIKTVGVG